MSKFTTSGVVVEEKKSSGSKYLSYGIQKAAIVGYEVKAASTGKQMVTLLMESPKVTDPGFEPDPTAKFGGKVGRVGFTIYFSPDDTKQMEQFLGNVAIIAKKFDVSEKVNAISSDTIDDYMSKLIPIIRGKFAYWAITAQEYQKKDSDKVGYTLGLRRFGFIATLDEMEANPSHLKPFDMSNPFDYKALAIPSKDPDEDPITKAFGPGEELPWD